MNNTHLPGDVHPESEARKPSHVSAVPTPGPGMEEGFRALYPVMPPPYILAAVRGIRKDTRTVHAPVSQAAIWRHLAPVDSPQHVALGISPNAYDPERGWTTSFLTVDLDVSESAPLDALAQHLAENAVCAYMCRSTTGRGWHLLVPLHEPVPSEIGARLSFRLVRAARHLTPSAANTRLEAFPSAVDSGQKVLLPYRGAGTDGFGFNPLVLACTRQPVPLREAHFIYRARLAEIEAALDALGPLPTEPPSSAGSSPVDTMTFAELPGSDLRFVRERERLAGHYVEGKRQDLAAGFAAYMALHGVPVEDAIGHVRLLSVSAGEPARETEQRLSAVKNTYLRRDRGKRIAFRFFYARAGVEPPVAVREPPVAAIKSVLRRALARRWRGNGGYTDLAVLVALVNAMYVHGRQPTPSTGEVALDCRTLATATNAQPTTVSKALRRLAKAGLIEIERSRRRSQAYTYRFRADDVHDGQNPTQSDVPIVHFKDLGGHLKDCVWIVGHAAFHTRALGGKAGYVAFLLRVLGPQSLDDLNRSAGGPVNVQIANLVDVGIAWHRDGRFALSNAWRSACDAHATLNGVVRLKVTKRQRIDADRALFHNMPPKAA